MPDSPLTAVVRALDALDVEAAVSQFAPDATLTMVFGQHAEGADQVRAALRAFCGELRSTRHELGAEWHPEPGVWIAELTATYQLRDFAELGPYRRAIIVRERDGAIVEMAVYGAHEPPLRASERPYQEVYAGGRWLPTL